MEMKEFEKIALDVAYSFDMDLEDIINRFDEGDVKVFSNRNEILHWLYLNNKSGMESFIEEVKLLNSHDIEGYDNVMHMILETDDRVYLMDNGMAIFLFE